MEPKSDFLKPLRFRLPGEVITREQESIEELGWYFIGNTPGDSVFNRVGECYRGCRYMLGKAYDMKGNPLPESFAVYVRPKNRFIERRAA